MGEPVLRRPIRQKYGGAAPAMGYCILMEELNRVCLPTSLARTSALRR
jgi:hypothetical protein